METVSDVRYTVYIGDYSVSHRASYESARELADKIRGRDVVVVERDRAYPFTHRKRWVVK